MLYNKSKRGFYTPKKGKVKRVRFDSSWEEKYMQLLDEPENDTAKWFKNGSGFPPITIPYSFEGENHDFIPDFIIIKKDGSKEVHEVKAFVRIGMTKKFADDKAEPKIKAIKAKCKELNYVFRLVRKFQ